MSIAVYFLRIFFPSISTIASDATQKSETKVITRATFTILAGAYWWRGSYLLPEGLLGNCYLKYMFLLQNSYSSFLVREKRYARIMRKVFYVLSTSCCCGGDDGGGGIDASSLAHSSDISSIGDIVMKAWCTGMSNLAEGLVIP